MKNVPVSDEKRHLITNAYEMLASFKWQDGFTCKSCGYTKFYSGSKPYSRKCSKCKHQESVTANTAFNKLKIPLEAAIYMVSRLIEDTGILPITGYCEGIMVEQEVKVSPKAVSNTLKRILSVVEFTPNVSKRKTRAFIYKHRQARILGFVSQSNSTLLFATTIRNNKYQKDVAETITKLGDPEVSRMKDFQESIFGVTGMITADKNLQNFYKPENLDLIEAIIEIENYLRGVHTSDRQYGISFGENNIQPYLNLLCLKKSGLGFADLMTRLTKDHKKYFGQ